MTRRTPGNYVPLDVNYVRDAAIRKAGPMAELLYIRSLAYAKGAKRGGVVPDYDLEVVGIGITRLKSLATKLVEVGLWVRDSDGWTIRSWERWNGEDEAVSAGARLGNHIRWHVKTGKHDPECEHCVASAGDRGAIEGRSPGESSPDVPPEIQGKGREGKEPQKTSSSSARSETTLAEDANAGQILGAWIDLMPRRPPTRLIGQVSREVKALLDDDFAPQQILEGLDVMTTKGLNPSCLASLVNDVVNRPSLRVAASGGERLLSRDEVERLIGQAPPLPEAPAELSPADQAKWLHDKVEERNDERQRRAQAKKAEIERRATPA